MQAVYLDACAKCSANVSDKRDLKTIKSRVKKEGLSFLTITLPRFCRDFEQALARGGIDSTLFLNFKKSGVYPAFLQGILSRLFDRETGRLSHEAESPTYVEAVRQICLLFKKVELQCTPERERAALDNYVDVELLNESFQLREDYRSIFRSVSSVLWYNMLAGLQPSTFVPRHGPGATAEGIRGNAKYSWQYWYDRLEHYFPLLGNGYSDSAALEEEFEKVTFVPESEELPVKVTLVPKTLKTPRVIAIEPVCMQYAQQAVSDALVRTIETYWLTRGHVNFTDQSINQNLALTSSKDGRFGTIDLSDASDRVLLDLASLLFAEVPDLWDLILACRSKAAILPDGRLVSPLAKFASMGSALCFPVESMVFYTICVVARLRKHNLPIDPTNIYNVSRDIYVYGDDIVIPVDDADTITDHLHEYHCKVNSSKSFWTGMFRESCGTDAYAGENVTPTYLRHMPPCDRRQARELLSWVSTANQFYLKGYWRTASLMFCTCEKILGSLPYVSPESSGLGRISYLGYRSAERWNDRLQRLEVRCWVPSLVYRCDSIDGYSALQKCLLSLERRTNNIVGYPEYEAGTSDVLGRRLVSPTPVDKAHLRRTARRGAVTLKLRWVSAT